MTDFVTIQMCQNTPPTTFVSEVGPNKPWCKQIWDESNASTAIAHACFDGNYDKAEEAVIRAYNRIIDGYEDLTLPEGRESSLDVFLLLGDLETLKAFANDWADYAIKDLPGVSGDDTFFDYFPDFISGLYQLCSQIQFPDPYNRFHDALWVTGSPYVDDSEAPDMFPGRL